MIELVFVVCMSHAPATCEERSLIYTDISTMTCMMGAQPALAAWVETHPDWRVANWKCKALRRERSA